jgi:hypothetical protein
MRRRMKKDRITVLKDDLKTLVELDGETVTFVWQEMSGGTYNEVYGVWEGGELTPKEHKVRGLGKVVDFKEDEMEYEYGRIRVGECIVRFPYDVDLTPIFNKEGVRFMFKGQRWKFNSEIGIGDTHDDQQYSILILGVKSVD